MFTVQTQRSQVHIQTPTHAGLWGKGIYYSVLKAPHGPEGQGEQGGGGGWEWGWGGVAEQQMVRFQGLLLCLSLQTDPLISLSPSLSLIAVFLSSSLCVCLSVPLPLPPFLCLPCLPPPVSLDICLVLSLCLPVPASRSLSWPAFTGGPLGSPLCPPALPLSRVGGQMWPLKPQISPHSVQAPGCWRQQSHGA